MNKKWGEEFHFHAIGDKLYTEGEYIWRECYTDIILNQVNGNAGLGTGVAPAVWQYPPHVLRTMTELTIPSGVAAIGSYGFSGSLNLKKVTIPGSVTEIENYVFYNCTNLDELILAPGVTSIGNPGPDCHLPPPRIGPVKQHPLRSKRGGCF